MRYLLIVTMFIVLFTACRTVEVIPNDSTPPTLSVYLFEATELNAHYTDGGGEPIVGEINTARPFSVQPRTDEENVVLVFIARDTESGISQIRTSLDVSFTCNANVIGGPVSRESGTTISGDFFERASPGESTLEARGVITVFNYEDLWRRGNCTRWEAIENIENGSLTGIQINYSGHAWNNSAGPGTDINGRFTASDGFVRIER